MGNFGRDNKSHGGSSSFRDRDAGRGGFGGRSSGGRFSDRNSPRPEMHEAKCDECGRKCAVPFKPTSGKPIYCSSCFETQGSVSTGRPDRNSRPPRNDFEDRQMYKAVCDDCGIDCQVPFKPSSDKALYCSDCFKKDANRSTGKADSYKEDFANLNNKMDHILKVLAHLVSKDAHESKKPAAVEEVKAPVAKKMPKEVELPKAPVAKKTPAKVSKPIVKAKKANTKKA